MTFGKVCGTRWVLFFRFGSFRKDRSASFTSFTSDPFRQLSSTSLLLVLRPRTQPFYIGLAHVSRIPSVPFDRAYLSRISSPGRPTGLFPLVFPSIRSRVRFSPVFRFARTSMASFMATGACAGAAMAPGRRATREVRAQHAQHAPPTPATCFASQPQRTWNVRAIRRKPQRIGTCALWIP